MPTETTGDCGRDSAPEIANNQNNVGHAWMATNWSGVCDELAKIAKPTLVIADDNYYAPHENALIIAGKIPGAWLVPIKDGTVSTLRLSGS